MSDVGETLTGPLDFDTVPLHDSATLCEHVRHALTLGLPEVRRGDVRTGALRIIANGPSARGAPLDGPTMALNGAMKLFAEAGTAPTWWAAADSQELVADFIEYAPPQTQYLVNSRCHPKVFETLLSRGRQVSLWHLDETLTWPEVQNLDQESVVNTSCSITLLAFPLGELLGWRAFDAYGWDGSCADGKKHANPQKDDKELINITVGDVLGRAPDKEFISTVIWCAEAFDAMCKLYDYPWPVEVHGDGMIGACLRNSWLKKMIEDARASIAA